MSINRVIISGNLTRDGELRRTQSGTAILSMGVAVNDRRKNSQTGEWEDEPCYVDCVMFGTRAESLANYLHKGNKVSIDGKLRYSSWEKDGNRRSKLDVLVDDLEMLTPKSQQGGSNQNGGSGYQGGAQGGYQQQSQPEYVESTVIDGGSVYDDIPW